MEKEIDTPSLSRSQVTKKQQGLENTRYEGRPIEWL